MKYKWIIKESQEISKEFLDIAFGLEIIAKLLINRGINTPYKARCYLDPTLYKESSPDQILNLLKAKDRIIEAINTNEKITIFGDYDVDGVTATSCLLLTLRQFTENVDFYIPSRLNEGYGLNIKAVKTLAKKNKTKLLITCDCGITNFKETELANKFGMDVIITDHHSLPEVLPPAYAILNPKLLPADHQLHFLPGVGVAYKLAEAILNEKHIPPMTHEDLLDLVTLGMIADLAPLVDENRYLVQIGLAKLAGTKKVGLMELLRICSFRQSSIEADHIGFGIAPRINAIGRLADAALAVKLLTTNDLAEAVSIATELDFQNKNRQTICNETLEEAVALVAEQVDLKKDKCIILAKERWHHGVLGIVASRVLEKYNLPTILIGIDREENIARGSGRSIEALNITEVLSLCSDHLEKFGGHKAACGLSIKPENIDNFILEFKNKATKALINSDLSPALMVDCELPLSKLNLDLINKINKLAPFGLGNPMPVFESEEVEIKSIKSIGKDRQHLKLTLKSVIARSTATKQSHNVKLFKALIWNYDTSFQFNAGDKLKVAYTPKLNNYNGETFVQLEIKDWQFVEAQIREPESQRAGEEGIELFDFRGTTQECLSLFSSCASVVYFAEVLQKDFLPLVTRSRSKIKKTDTLILLECPPDGDILKEIIKAANPAKLYFSFPWLLAPDSRFYLKRLIGMLRYTITSKNSKVSLLDLQSALGLNKITLIFAIETLKRINVLSCKLTNDELTVNSLNQSTQDFSDLVEYNLFTSELKKIMLFREWLSQAALSEIKASISTRETVRV